jgi:hypothetical protein
MATSLSLRLHQQALSVIRLRSDEPVPDWVFAGPGIAAAVRRDDELGVVCATERVPADVTREDGWVALVVDGPLDFALTGILAAIAAPLAEAGVSIYALSTYDTDVVLVRHVATDDALAALAAAGHRVSRVS